MTLNCAGIECRHSFLFSLCMLNLFYRETGSGYPLLLLHGLWGASENWLPVAHRLSSHFRVILPDLRNHGRSPHHPLHTYKALAEDIARLVQQLRLPVKPHLAGHSMGGKALMYLLLKYPGIAASGIMLDIAPVSYPLPPEHKRLFDFFHSTDLTSLHHSQELKQHIIRFFPAEKEQQIVLKNIRREKDTFQWKINVPALYHHRTSLCEWPEELKTAKYPSEVLFIKGENSPYICGPEVLKNNFPAALLSVLPQAGHWLHTEQPENLCKLLLNYLRKD